MRKIVAMAVICLTAASGLTSAYAAQLADDEAGLRIRLKTNYAGLISPVLAREEIFTHGYREDCSISIVVIIPIIIGVEGGAYYVYKLGARADMSTRWYLDGDKSFGFAPQ